MSDMQPKIIYSARLSDDDPSLTKLIIAQETEQTIIVSDKEAIIGDSWSQYFGYRRVHKNSLNLFDTLNGAIEYLSQELEDSVKRLERKIDQNKQAIAQLEAIRLNNV